MSSRSTWRLSGRRIRLQRSRREPLAADCSAISGRTCGTPRTLWKRPGFTVAAVLTLAIGIGSNAAIFTVINAVLLRPLPFPHSEQLVSLYTRYLPSSGYNFPYFGLSGPGFADVRGRVNAFASVAAYSFSSSNLSRGNGEAERVLTMRVTSEFFDTLGVRPVRGRTFTEAEAQRGGSCLALLSHGALADAASAIGSTIRLDDALCEVIGVMPEGFGFRDDRVKVWTALPINTGETQLNRQSHGLVAVARLRDGVNAEQADAQLQSLRGYWSEEYPDHYAKGHFAVIRPLHEDIVGDQRDALVLLALVGAAVGVPSALALTRLMGGMLSGVTSADPVTYIAVVGMLVISALLASYLPARRATRVDPIVALRAE